MAEQSVSSGQQTENNIGLSKMDYKGAPSTLCQGCGHNSIANQIITALYELNLIPEKVIKFSGIGCSSKSPTYFLGRSFGFNGLHGRMPSLALGTIFGDTSLKAIGISGDGDTASIGLGQFKHLVRRNLPMVYIVENNGVYGLTKGQFSATAEIGLQIKREGVNQYLPVDICLEALTANASFVARSFAGDPKQVRELIKSALAHRGIAVIDIISPCVTFHNQDNTFHSFSWGKENERPIHEVSYIPANSEIIIEDFEDGTIREVELFDGSIIQFRKIEKDYDPTDKLSAYRLLSESAQNNLLVTGLIYINPNQKTMFDLYDLPGDVPLNRLQENRLRPPRESMGELNSLLF